MKTTGKNSQKLEQFIKRKVEEAMSKQLNEADDKDNKVLYDTMSKFCTSMSEYLEENKQNLDAKYILLRLDQHVKYVNKWKNKTT